MSENTIDKLEELRKWYFKKVKKHAFEWRTFLGIFIFFCVLQAAIALSGVIIRIYENSGSGSLFGIPTNDVKDDSRYYWVLFFFSIWPFLYLFPNIFFYSVEKILRYEKYVLLSPNQFPRLWDYSLGLMTNMGLGYQLQIVYAKSDTLEAHVSMKGGIVYLILTRGLISYSHTHERDVESIIGHEMGHMVQRDSQLLIFGRRMMTVPRYLSIIQLVLTVCILMVAHSSDGNLHYFKYLIGPSVMLFIFERFNNCRKNAEHYADLASIIFVEKSTIREFIEEFVPEEGKSGYPSRMERIQFLDSALSNYR